MVTPPPRSPGREERWAGIDEDATPGQLTSVLADAARGLWSLATVCVGLAVGLTVAGMELTNWLAFVGVVAVAMITLEVVFDPVLRRLASGGSVVTALVLGTGAQLTVMSLALAYVTPVSAAESWRVGIVPVVAAMVVSLGRWIVGASESAYIIGAATGGSARRAAGRRRRAARVQGAARRGLLVVMLDGLGMPTLRRAMEGGQAPNLARWSESTHELTTWWATIPSTTPASMAGFLYGDESTVPAFRWWDRRAGRLLAASSPNDARLMESRFSAARPGLLAGGGTAISTTFTGGAKRAYLTISNARSRGLGSGSAYVRFFARPLLLPGALALTVGEVVKEMYQARRQRVRGVQPRIQRRPGYMALRGLTNVLLRKLNLSLVAQEMAAGRPVILVDFVDYDEIAHHAGPERPEALRALEGLDGVLQALQQVARTCTTEYELVVVSDHGQALGTTFEQLTGHTLAARVHALMGFAPTGPVETGTDGSGEDFAPVNALLDAVLGRRTKDPARLVLGPDGPRARPPSPEGLDAVGRPVVAVTGGGNLGMIWFPRLPRRPTLSSIACGWPRLVPGLLATDGIGLVMAIDDDSVPIVMSARGARRLWLADPADDTHSSADPADDTHSSAPEPVVADVEVTGSDPLAGYPSRTAADLVRLASVSDCGDLVVISTVDESGRVHAFEHQVGSHGGAQNYGVLLHPRDWTTDSPLAEVVPELGPDPVLIGPGAVYTQLSSWRDSWVGTEPSCQCST